MEQNQLISQIDINVDANWDKIRNTYNRIVDIKNSEKFQKNKEVAYDCEIYSLDKYGHMISSTSLTDDVVWNIWGGKLLENLLPNDLLNLKNEMIDHGLNFINFDYFQHYGNVSEHIDGKKYGEAHIGHCNINYIVSAQDQMSTTFARVDQYYESYRSVPGTAWLLNTGVMHKVNNCGFREVFQIKIYSPFEQIKDFFQNRSMLTRPIA